VASPLLVTVVPKVVELFIYMEQDITFSARFLMRVKMQYKQQRGFTLLEIMVVIVILGILASLVVPNLMGNKDQADHQKAVSDIVALENALDMYKLDNSRYPSTDQGLNALIIPSGP